MHTRQCPEMNNPYFTKKKINFALCYALHSRNACHQENYISNLVLPLKLQDTEVLKHVFYFFLIVT